MGIRETETIGPLYWYYGWSGYHASPYGVVDSIVRTVDESSGNIISNRTDAEAIFLNALDVYDEIRSRAVESGNLPDLSRVDGSRPLYSKRDDASLDSASVLIRTTGVLTHTNQAGSRIVYKGYGSHESFLPKKLWNLPTDDPDESDNPDDSDESNESETSEQPGA